MQNVIQQSMKKEIKPNWMLNRVIIKEKLSNSFIVDHMDDITESVATSDLLQSNQELSENILKRLNINWHSVIKYQNFSKSFLESHLTKEMMNEWFSY